MKGMQYILRGKGFFYGWVLFSIPIRCGWCISLLHTALFGFTWVSKTIPGNQESAYTQ